MKNESKPEIISEIRPESKENAAVEFADGIKIIRNIPYTEERETRNRSTADTCNIFLRRQPEKGL